MLTRFARLTRQRVRRLLALGLLLGAAGLLWGVTRSHLAAGDSRTACPLPDSDQTPHPGMVWVPAGHFVLGDTVYPEELPLRPTQVAGFWMDRTEVTNAQFRAFVQATGYVTVAERPVDTKLHSGLPSDMQQPGAVVFTMPTQLRNTEDIRLWWRYVPGANWRHPGGPGTDIQGRDAYPVVNVTIDDARAYAHWRGGDLPTEAEFEWAARGGDTQPNDHEQPREANTWQGSFPVRNTGKDGFDGLAPVACFKPNNYGIHDLIGNVWEITKDIYHPTHDGADNTPPDEPPMVMRADTLADMRHVIKGGSYLCAPNYCMRYRPGARQAKEDDLASSHVGFRTVLRAPGPG